MSELPEPIGPVIDEAILARFPEALAKYEEMKRMHREYCRGIRKRHRGEAQEAMLRYEQEVFRLKVKQLVEDLVSGQRSQQEHRIIGDETNGS